MVYVYTYAYVCVCIYIYIYIYICIGGSCSVVVAGSPLSWPWQPAQPNRHN